MGAYNDLATKLKEDEHIPRVRRIRKNLAAIEEVLSTGITIDYLVSRLNEYGFLIKFDTFKAELYREIKKLKKQ